MGGGRFEGGNITPVAEFNIFADPHAAQAVLHAGVPVVLHPLDVTHRALTSGATGSPPSAALGTRPGIAVADMLAFAQTYDMERYGADGGPLHDPNVIAWLLRPDLYAGRDVNVEVETGSELTMGQTVIDWWGATEPAEERARRARGRRRRLLRAAGRADRPALTGPRWPWPALQPSAAVPDRAARTAFGLSRRLSP